MLYKDPIPRANERPPPPIIIRTLGFALVLCVRLYARPSTNYSSVSLKPRIKSVKGREGGTTL